jgi:hypothetical protein
MTLMLVPIVGGLGMAAEGSNWWLTQRAAQNAADTAAMSASWNGTTAAAGSGSTSSYSTSGCSTTPTAFDCEAVGAAARAGFTNGSSNVVVYPQYLTDKTTPACPSALKACYRVSVTRTLQVYLLGLALGGQSSQNVQAVAYASLVNNGGTTPDCLFALAKTGGDAFTTNGSPNANLAGCDIQIGSSSSTSPANATCNGHNLGADAAFATGSNDGCGKSPVANASPVSDPYAALASNIPSDTCGGQPANYPQAPQKKNDPALPASNIIGGSVTWGSVQKFCGDVQLSSSATVTSNTTLYIYNGGLDLNGNTLQTASGASLTIVFTGSDKVGTGGSAITPNHNFAVGNGNTLDINAPSSGTWSGIAVYQDPNLTKNVDLTAGGNGANSFNLNLSGVLYQPNANDTLSGVIGKSTNGSSCFVWVFNTMTVNGTANIFQGTQSQCSQAGVTQVFSGSPVHELVG